MMAAALIRDEPTGSTVSPSARRNVQVVAREGMTSGTFVKSSAPHVLGMGDRFQMVGEDAGPVAAQVIEFQPIGDWANEVLVGPTVSEHYRPRFGHGLDRETPVAQAVPVSLPFSTSRRDFLNEPKESNLKKINLRVSVSVPAGVVHRAPAPGIARRPVASSNQAGLHLAQFNTGVHAPPQQMAQAS